MTPQQLYELLDKAGLEYDITHSEVGGNSGSVTVESLSDCCGA